MTDQRGYARIANSTVDRGAVELNSSTVTSNSTITGQVTAPNGRAVSGAPVSLRDAQGAVKFAVTNPFGFFRFLEVPAGGVYTVECLDKRNNFPAHNVFVEELVEYVDF